MDCVALKNQLQIEHIFDFWNQIVCGQMVWAKSSHKWIPLTGAYWFGLVFFLEGQKVKFGY